MVEDKQSNMVPNAQCKNHWMCRASRGTDLELIAWCAPLAMPYVYIPLPIASKFLCYTVGQQAKRVGTQFLSVFVGGTHGLLKY